MKYLEDRKYVCPQPYNLQYPRLNQSIKWWFDYMMAAKKNRKNGSKNSNNNNNGCFIGQVLWRYQLFSEE